MASHKTGIPPPHSKFDKVRVPQGKEDSSSPRAAHWLKRFGVVAGAVHLTLDRANAIATGGRTQGTHQLGWGDHSLGIISAGSASSLANFETSMPMGEDRCSAPHPHVADEGMQGAVVAARTLQEQEHEIAAVLGGNVKQIKPLARPLGYRWPAVHA